MGSQKIIPELFPGEEVFSAGDAWNEGKAALESNLLKFAPG
jgi:hypothetical protein